ncbi:hypothetical protein HK099_006063 [Clydaea vesicula]|uniref:Tc1-like transposase DDE domain-containing protein n=1 Tax=Clydaea vesicula TaxID=447962 RepID=A0AAD5U9U5_9FUNG|nr:hypothetical protein HK099_006063 [Clydaea vesicula]
MPQPSSLSQEYTTIVKRKHHSEQVKLSALYAFRKGDFISVICSKFKISRSTFFYWRRQRSTLKNVKPLKKTGRKERLTPDQQQKLIDFYKKHPTATNEQASAHINNIITRKKVSDEPENYPDDRVLQETREFISALSDIPMKKRVYMDESFVYDNEARSYGRSLRGKRISRQRKRHRKRWWTFYLAIRMEGIVHAPLISTENATLANFWIMLKKFCLHVYGKEMCKNPSKQHYNPEAKATIESKRARILLLPPKGKYFNPIELAFGTIKTNIRNSYTLSKAGGENRPRNDKEVRVKITMNDYNKMKQAVPNHFNAFHYEQLAGQILSLNATFFVSTDSTEYKKFG